MRKAQEMYITPEGEMFSMALEKEKERRRIKRQHKLEEELKALEISGGNTPQSQV